MEYHTVEILVIVSFRNQESNLTAIAKIRSLTFTEPTADC